MPQRNYLGFDVWETNLIYIFVAALVSPQAIQSGE
jgi:hypothetical protein